MSNSIRKLETALDALCRNARKAHSNAVFVRNKLISSGIKRTPSIFNSVFRNDLVKPKKQRCLLAQRTEQMLLNSQFLLFSSLFLEPHFAHFIHLSSTLHTIQPLSLSSSCCSSLSTTSPLLVFTLNIQDSYEYCYSSDEPTASKCGQLLDYNPRSFRFCTFQADLFLRRLHLIQLKRQSNKAAPNFYFSVDESINENEIYNEKSAETATCVRSAMLTEMN